MGTRRSDSAGRAVAAIAAHPWHAAFAVAGAAVVALHLAALDTAPPGLYNDEASVGYNAYAIARAGVDEHGVSHPLFFQAFGDYKGPVYIYPLSLLLRVLPLTPAVVRLPAALSGIAICALAALTAWHLTRSRVVALLMLLMAAAEPWLVVESRTALEANIQMVLCLVAAVWCLAAAERSSLPHAWHAGAGVALSVAVFAYTPARLFAGIVAVLIVVSYAGPRAGGRRGWWLALPTTGLGYTVLLWWSSAHPGALTARFNLLSISSDSPSFWVLARRFVDNYVDYFTPSFLFTHGDANLRHNTGFGGMLLITTAPALVAGLVVCARRWREPLPRLALLGLLAAPVPAALTMEGTPHSLRAATMLPFLLLLAVYGWAAMLPLLLQYRAAALALGVAVAVECGGYFYDLYAQWPARALAWFDAGEGPAIARAAELAQGHRVVVSQSLDQPYIQAYFWLRADPAAVVSSGPAAIGVLTVDAGQLGSSSLPGDVLVLAPQDAPPPGATLLEQETVTVTHPVSFVGQPDAEQVVLASLYRR